MVGLTSPPPQIRGVSEVGPRHAKLCSSSGCSGLVFGHVNGYHALHMNYSRAIPCHTQSAPPSSGRKHLIRHLPHSPRALRDTRLVDIKGLEAHRLHALLA